ncbi:hypothetical protein BKA70DRAFT_1526887 [Coprinopsis sp. MPI-PUGE-AT-0042]|nr:hypothetical protein BKA70DRAFT_1526887 [Coprinopsis sp. MPI-PUGE-AT-0042]
MDAANAFECHNIEDMTLSVSEGMVGESKAGIKDGPYRSMVMAAPSERYRVAFCFDPFHDHPQLSTMVSNRTIRQVRPSTLTDLHMENSVPPSSFWTLRWVAPDCFQATRSMALSYAMWTGWMQWNRAEGISPEGFAGAQEDPEDEGDPRYFKGSAVELADGGSISRRGIAETSSNPRPPRSKWPPRSVWLLIDWFLSPNEAISRPSLLRHNATSGDTTTQLTSKPCSAFEPLARELWEDSFQSCICDHPSLEVQVPKDELVQMYREMFTMYGPGASNQGQVFVAYNMLASARFYLPSFLLGADRHNASKLPNRLATGPSIRPTALLFSNWPLVVMVVTPCLSLEASTPVMSLEDEVRRIPRRVGSSTRKPKLTPSSNMPRPQPEVKDPWGDLYYKGTEMEMRGGRGVPPLRISLPWTIIGDNGWRDDVARRLFIDFSSFLILLHPNRGAPFNGALDLPRSLSLLTRISVGLDGPRCQSLIPDLMWLSRKARVFGINRWTYRGSLAKQGKRELIGVNPNSVLGRQSSPKRGLVL